MKLKIVTDKLRGPMVIDEYGNIVENIVSVNLHITPIKCIANIQLASPEIDIELEKVKFRRKRLVRENT